MRLYEESTEPNFLAVATPGAGKTTFALTAARRAMMARRVRRLIVVVPTQHLKTQWAQAAERFDLHLDPAWASAYGALPSDVHGVVVTYQQVAANPGALRPLVRDAMVVLDEIHHAGESRSWGDGVRFAFEPAARRLCLSGTPFRSDTSTIPFVRYDNDLAKADYDYGYGEALKDRAVVRPVYFPRINGHMEWTAPDGSQYAATFDDKLTRDLANQRLRTALNAQGEWLPGVIAQAHAQLSHLRAQDRRAGGLIIATDQDHARAIAEILRDKLRVHATIATSDDPEASRKIAEFQASHAPWLVAVRMVSEGVDIPRLRVGVFATSTLTELFFRQAVGRLVRWHGGTARQTAYMFIPDDLRLRHHAGAIAEQRRHCLQRKIDEDEVPRQEGAPAPEPELLDEAQGNLFEAISAVPLDEQGRPLAVRVYEELGGEEIPDYVGNSPALPAPPEPPPRRLRGSVPLPDPQPVTAAPAKSALARRRSLRESNSEIVRELAHVTGKSHAELNAELNRKAGIKSVGGATVKQLEQRLAVGKKLLER